MTEINYRQLRTEVLLETDVNQLREKAIQLLNLLERTEDELGAMLIQMQQHSEEMENYTPGLRQSRQG